MKATKPKLRDQIRVDADDHLASSESMVGGSGTLTRVNDIGDPSSRRQNKAALKAEAIPVKADNNK